MSRERFVKPRVFLSHAKKDSLFIDRLERSLRLCQIEPWLDTFEIRHGKPWLDAIFEDGIPNCDSVLVYFTQNSLVSAVVSKELDAGVVSQLADSSVSLLPYVEEAPLRSEIRMDIQALQVPVWNEENFDSILAQCVAEIWRSFHERRIAQAVADEKLRRMEAEKALSEVGSSKENDEAEFAGLSFSELCETLGDLGLSKFLDRARGVLADGGRTGFAVFFSKMKEFGYVEQDLRILSTRLVELGLLENDGVALSLSRDGFRFLNRYEFENRRSGKEEAL